ncbi:MAG: maltose alpha-D-glucosyltransferase [Planctomycetes bacterium]|nr:maltose alpha-D-glucosyltransferase [Planctomycetota bacterium]
MVLDDPHWYRDAIIYEVHVRGFFDSVGDGHGDFRGLTEKLDYLHDLGITTIWLLPFYPSPLKDDGYDIADYTDINPQFGKLCDFRAFLNAAHDRGLKVITELVLNHTSDQHPWFQRARRALPGSSERDFYVWNESPEKYRDARVIFQDFEPSNWSWDPIAKSYYWHRFYSHQPDLNFDNPAVWDAIYPVVDFWFDLGVDGMRLDAVPYLYEREGTSCENLPETHQFLKALRRHVDSRFAGRMFLAEANQWPEDAVTYFGDGDECQMAFHFPLMPRLFMALHQEDRFPIQDILAQTPAIPGNCQWCLFLRNHDELTLEMVTDEERDYMYRAYTRDRHARINLGIRHRLAPLLRNDRRRIELMYALLCSLPGTPVIYYGDEIGMGDNIYLGDRNGVRTPMQWSADRNAGFSRANPQKLYLPVIIDPEYHYETVNVEAQQGNPSSLLWWIKRLINHRKSLRCLSRGTFRLLHPENTKVLVYVRELEHERVLVVANLSRFVQVVQLNLREFAGYFPEEVLGRTRFPTISEQPYLLSIGPHGFMWFTLTRSESSATVSDVSQQPAQPELALLPGQEPVEKWFQSAVREQIEALLPAFVRRQRSVFTAAEISYCEISAVTPVRIGERTVWILLVEVDPLSEFSETISMAMTFVPEAALGQLLMPVEFAGLARVAGPESGLLCDALALPDVCRTLLRGILKGRSRELGDGEITSGMLLNRPREDDNAAESLALAIHRSWRGNVSIFFGQSYVLKIYHRVEEGLNPDLEVGKFLGSHGFECGFAGVIGSVEYRLRGADPATLAVLHRFVPNHGTGWQFALDQLSHYFERVAAFPRDMTAPVGSFRGERGQPQGMISDSPVDELTGRFRDAASQLGRRTAELHALLAQGQSPEFASEAFGRHYQRSVYQSCRNLTGRLMSRLTAAMGTIPNTARPLVHLLLAQEDLILQRFRAILDASFASRRIRCHGDYHLGQLLFTGKDFVITDFTGDPTKTVSERRIKRSPLRDIASMIRSLEYAVLSVLLGLSDLRGQPQGVVRPEDRPFLQPWADYWYESVSRTLMDAYIQSISPHDLLPRSIDAIHSLLQVLLLEKSLIEIETEFDNRLHWIEIPLRGAVRLLGYDPWTLTQVGDAATRTSGDMEKNN